MIVFSKKFLDFLKLFYSVEEIFISKLNPYPLFDYNCRTKIYEHLSIALNLEYSISHMLLLILLIILKSIIAAVAPTVKSKTCFGKSEKMRENGKSCYFY